MLRLAALRGVAPNTLGHRPEPEVLPLPAETSREAQKCCAWQHREGGPRNAQSLKCCPCQQKRCAWQHQGGGPRNALGHRPEPEVLLPAETSRQAPKCRAWQHRGGGGAPLQSAAPGSIEGGGPETRSGTVQSLKCCPCQQKRAARLQSAAPGSIQGGGPRNALGHRPEPEVLPLPAETSRQAPFRGGAPKRARAPSRA